MRIKFLVILLLIIALLVALFASEQEAGAGGGGAILLPLVANGPEYPPLVWDEERADYLGVILERAPCVRECWRLVELDIKDDIEGAGRHAFFVKAFDNGHQLDGIPIRVSWPGGGATAQTKSPPDWGDFALWDCFFPELGEQGAYSGSIGAIGQGDIIRYMGLPACNHWSFWAVYEWVP